MHSSFVFFINRYGLLGMFVLVAIENMGIPLPTEPAYVVGQLRIANGLSSYPMVLLALFAGHMAGSIISYFAGRKLGIRMQHAKDVELTDMQKKLVRWYEKYGMVTVFATRLIGHVRPWSSYVAGIAEVRPLPFILLTALGSFLFNIISLAITSKLIYFWAHFAILRILISGSFSLGLIFLLLQVINKKRRQIKK